MAAVLAFAVFACSAAETPAKCSDCDRPETGAARPPPPPPPGPMDAAMLEPATMRPEIAPVATDAGAPPPVVDASRPPAAAETSADAAIILPTFDASIGGLRMPVTATHLATSAHDPAMIQVNGVYYLFATGGNLSMRTSTNLIDWRAAGTVLPGVPAWASAAIGGPPEGLWAPDISFFGGKYRLYFAASTFGSNSSAIGLATNTTLDPASPDYRWVDEGLVIRSTSADRWNAIDPNVALDADGQPWLSFGSFWDGIKMRKLDPVTGKVSATDTTLYAIASRGGGAIEAPSIVSAHNWYYLFVSFDLCCKGAASTYRTMVGRSAAITGPYVDAAGKLMSAGGGTEVLATAGRYVGPGGGTALRDNDQLLYVHHYYDGMSNGRSTLQIHPLALDVGDWIVAGPPLWP